MKITIISRAPFVAGAEIAGERLALGLTGAGHEVLMIVGTDGEALKRFRSKNIRTECVPTSFTGDGLGFRYRHRRNTLRKILIKEKPDIVHSNDLPTHQMASDAARILSIPRVCHHRWIFDSKGTDWFNKFGAEKHVFVSSDAMRNILRQSHSIDESICEVLYDGLEIPGLPSEKSSSQAKQKLGLIQDKVTVLFAGQIIERKGVADILNAWNRLPVSTRSTAELVLAGEDLDGDGRYRKKMEALARELRVDAKFVGFQTNVPEWLTAADLVLVPSHVEPLGNATLEAMAMGKPVIGTKVGGIPEMIVDHQCGLLVKPHDPDSLATAIDRLINNQTQRRQFGSQALARCRKKFSLSSHTQEALRIYRQLIAK